MEQIEKLYKLMMERWNFMTRLGGEWNAGYAEGIKYAMSLVYEEKRALKANEKPSDNLEDYHGYKNIYKKMYNKYEGGK